MGHRVMWYLVHGLMKKGIVIRHTCDNMRCINPEHLLSGSHKDNNGDMHSRGRAYKLPAGEDAHGAKLSNKDVEAIRREAAAGRSFQELAKEFLIHPAHVSRVARGLSRKYDSAPAVPRLRRKPVTEKVAKKVVKLRLAGKTWEDISAKLSISRAAADRAFNRYHQPNPPTK